MGHNLDGDKPENRHFLTLVAFSKLGSSFHVLCQHTQTRTDRQTGARVHTYTHARMHNTHTHTHTHTHIIALGTFCGAKYAHHTVTPLSLIHI